MRVRGLAAVSTALAVLAATTGSARAQSPQSGLAEPPPTAAVFVGAATPTSTPAGQPVAVGNAADLSDVVSGPSASLQSAITTFFRLGGKSAWVVPVASEDAATLTAAVTAASAQDFAGQGAVLWTVPAMGSLEGDGYQGVAVALGTAAAADPDHIAVLDPPASLVPADGDAVAPLVGLAGILRQVLAQPQKVMLLSSALVQTDTNTVVAGSAAVAGEIASEDSQTGLWTSPSGPDELLADLSPSVMYDNTATGTLLAANVDMFRVIPGHGTFVAGAKTLAQDSDNSALNDMRLLTLVDQTLQALLLSYALSPDNAEIWQAVQSQATSFLASVQADGGLAGTTPEQGYTVVIGPGTSMSEQDLADGVMVLNVTLNLVDGRHVALSLSQQTPESAS